MNSVKNVQQVMARRSFPEFLRAMGDHVDVKEWSEVGGVFNAVRSVLRRFRPDVIVEAGCGKRPTLATMLALNYSIPVYVTDPGLDTSYASNVKGLGKFTLPLHGLSVGSADPIDEHGMRLIDVTKQRSVLLVANHSHHSRKDAAEFVKMFDAWVYITVPCCKHNTLLEPSIVKEDIHMHSPKNKIYTQAFDKRLLADLVGGL